ncbi:MAG: enoyl-ACP reductase [Anaerolineae bacterium]|nr:enoyl-ACP reductase [Anaerolineae bacterium]
MGLMDGKVILVAGVANKNSIAWGIAERLHQEGAEIAFSYAEPRLERRVRPLAEQVGARFVEICDVTQDEDIDRLFDRFKAAHGRLDGMVHSVAFAPREDLRCQFTQITREGFHLALDISAYSLLALTRRAVPLMSEGSAVLTMTYYAAEKVIPSYGVMSLAKAALECSVRYLAYELGPRNIRVNAISAGPIKTLAARGINNFSIVHSYARETAPLRHDITIESVGDTALWLMSSLSSSVTGEVVHVDGGYNVLGLTVPDSLGGEEVCPDPII